MLDIFMSCYGNIIENASDGHCMKVTGFPLEVLPELRNKINSRETQAECYILSETLSGLPVSLAVPSYIDLATCSNIGAVSASYTAQSITGLSFI